MIAESGILGGSHCGTARKTRERLLKRKLITIAIFKHFRGGGWEELVRSTTERAVRVRALVGNRVLLGSTIHSHSASLHPGGGEGSLFQALRKLGRTKKREREK